MRGVIVKILAIVLPALATLLGVLKYTTDWIGRSTVIDDASALWGKASTAMLWLADQPAIIFYWLPAALVVAALLLAFQPEIAAVLAGRGRSSDERMGYFLDYSVWDNIPELPLHQAAALWAEMIPARYGKSLSSDAMPHLQMLVMAANRGDLRIERSRSRGHESLERRGNDIVTRADLRTYAEKIGQKPKFLYSEARRRRGMI